MKPVGPRNFSIFCFCVVFVVLLKCKVAAVQINNSEANGVYVLPFLGGIENSRENPSNINQST
jgi:hypothetical protein